jgi:RimJ/RimL family protein N-acetyltransferase
MKSQEELELEFRDGSKIPIFPGYSHRLEFRALQKSDATLLAPSFKGSAKTIRTYLSEFQFADRWNLKDTQAFINACLNDQFPAMHYVFTIGKSPVAFASFQSFGESPTDVQFIIAVFGNHQGKGIGKAVAQTLKKVAFEIWGFERIWWIVDATNRSSMSIATSIGCEWDSTFEGDFKHGESGTGLWHRYVVERGRDLSPGILQGASHDYWTMPKSVGLLQAVTDSQKKNPKSQMRGSLEKG